jgi:hypothetical protein
MPHNRGCSAAWKVRSAKWIIFFIIADANSCKDKAALRRDVLDPLLRKVEEAGHVPQEVGYAAFNLRRGGEGQNPHQDFINVARQGTTLAILLGSKLPSKATRLPFQTLAHTACCCWI